MKLKAEHLTRQADIIPLNVLNTPITVVGAGAVGSFVTLGLAKMGFNNIVVYDYDTVDIVNMNSQFYRFSDIGKSKVNALKKMIIDYADVSIDTRNFAWKGTPLGRSIIISAADCMSVRRMLWEANPLAKAVIDTRMGAEFASMYVMKPYDASDSEDYPNTLYSNSEAIQAPCTAKSTVYTATLIAGQVCKAVKDIVLDKNYIRILHWDIQNNGMTRFLKEEG